MNNDLGLIGKYPRALRVQLALLVSILVAGSMIIFALRAMQQETERISAAMKRQAIATAKNIELPSEDYLLNRDYYSLEKLLLRTAHFPSVLDIRVSNTHGEILGAVIHEPSAEPVPVYHQPILPVPIEKKVQILTDPEYMVIWQPIISGNLPLGWVRIQYSQEEIKQAQTKIWKENLLDNLFLVGLALGILMVFLRNPLKTIAEYTNFAEKLNKVSGEQLEINSNSQELRTLGSALNEASAKLHQQAETIKSALNDLEALKYAVDQHCIVSITDTFGNITYVNDKFCESSQYSAQELLGKNHRILNSGYHPSEYFHAMWETLSKGETWYGEMRNLKKDGGYYWVDTTIVPFMNNAGYRRKVTSNSARHPRSTQS